MRNIKVVYALGVASLMIMASHDLSAQVARQTIEVTAEQLDSYPDGKYDATWESLESNYSVPEWFKDAKFGIFIHWGPYTVPAVGSEWYPKHMYNRLSKAHREISCIPFVAKGRSVDSKIYPRVKKSIDKCAVRVKALAGEFDAEYIDTNKLFNSLTSDNR